MTFNKLLCLFILIGMTTMSACKKGQDEIEYLNTFYIPQYGFSEHFPLLGTSIYELGIYKSGWNQSSNETVALGLDLNGFHVWRESNPEYEVLPEKYYNLPTRTISFEPNQERLNYPIELKNIDETFKNKKYVLPVRIRYSSENVEVNTEKSSAFLCFTRFRNIYEGTYNIVGNIIHEGEDDVIRVNHELESISVSEHTIRISGEEPGVNLYMTINDGLVHITAAPGSEKFQIISITDNNSLSGAFDPVYQRFNGSIKFSYTYIIDGKKREAEMYMSFFL